MTEAEKLTTAIGEFVYSEIDDVNRLEYTKDKDGLTAFTTVMENGKRYAVNIKET